MPKPAPRFRRWTADTEVAFLMALRHTGSLRGACAAIGRSTHGACDRRRRLPDFAAKWQAVLDEWQAEQAAARRAETGADEERAMDNRARYDGLTPLRQRALLRALTETGNYEDACKRVGLSATGVRRMRARYPAFAAACEQALGRSIATLEQVAIDRAVNGVEEPVWHAGKIVGTRIVRSDSLLKMMVRRGDASAGVGKTQAQLERAAEEAARLAGGFFARHATREETNRSLRKYLDGYRRRTAMEAAQKADQLRIIGEAP